MNDRLKLRFRRLVGFVTGQSTPLPQAHALESTPAVVLAAAPATLQPSPSPDSDFDTLLAEGRIRTLFQPIVSLRDGSVFGYEALSRGPIGTRLETADALFRAAERSGGTRELERVCRFRAIASAASLPATAFLFLNISPHVLDDPNAGLSREIMEASHLVQERIVLEITEKEAIFDFERFKRALVHYNQQGFKVAIDDAGAGHNSLRAVTEVRPHFIKLDMALVRDIDRDGAKNALVSAIIMFARRIDARVLGEGVETVEELVTLIELGVDYGQGFLLARPSAAYAEPRPEIAAYIRERSAAKGAGRIAKRASIESIARRAPTLEPGCPAADAIEMFERNPEVSSVVVTKSGAPIGLISRTKLYERFSHQFGRSLYATRPVRLVIDDAYLAVDGKESIGDVARKVVDRRRTAMYDELVVLDGGMYSGVVSMPDLLQALTGLPAPLSGSFNPLTGLPARGIFSGEVDRRGEAGVPFALLHVEPNQLRLYNERHGFDHGDEIVKALGATLSQAAKDVDPDAALVAHLGGVEFVIACSPTAAQQLGRVISDRWSREANWRAAASVQAEKPGGEGASEITLTIAGITAAHAPIPQCAALLERLARYKRMKGGVDHSVFVLDGRLVPGPQLPGGRRAV
ncbi:MAG: GGDEF domain-containing protein [Candidatus Eremiobacteraeota bacterium]|nr:GGDEF domain-containing protein [Candidatus Eremiobacteraeota bacterium]